MRTILISALLSLAAACGDVTGPGGGGGSDGGPDGGPDTDAAVPGTVQVTVLDADGTREPVEDTPVVFFQPDGSVADTVDTDADGVASAELLPGGAVMAFTTIDAPLGVFQPQIWAVVGVKPGDEIVLGGQQTNQAPVTSMTFDLPPIKTNNFLVNTPCGGYGWDSSSVPMSLYSNCDDSPTAAIALAFIGEDTYVVTDSSIPVEDETAADIGVGWDLVPSPDVTVENLDDVRFMEMAWAHGFLGGHNIPLGLPTVSGPVGSGQLTLAPHKVVDVDDLELHVVVSSELLNLGTQLWSISLPGGDEDELVVDADDHRLPWVGKPVYDAATHHFGWPQVGEGDWDASYIAIQWFTAEGKINPVYGHVGVVAPPGVHDVVLPAVPEEFEEWLPPNLDSVNADVHLFDSNGLEWDSARQLGMDPGDLFNYPGMVTEPATIRYSTSIVFDD